MHTESNLGMKLLFDAYNALSQLRKDFGGEAASEVARANLYCNIVDIIHEIKVVDLERKEMCLYIYIYHFYINTLCLAKLYICYICG